MSRVLRALLPLAVALASAFGTAWAREPPAEPMLRIETGTHGADVTGLAADASGRLLATSSYDRTVRLWSVADQGASPKVLRVPVDLDREGILYAVALSPDGRRVVTAGWTGEENGAWSLYVFDAASGRMERRIPDLPHRVVTLAFSKDGRRLAAGLKAGRGLLVFDAEDWSVAASDADQADDVPSLDFDRDGRLVLVSLDGAISLYDADFRRLGKVKAPGGDRPAIARFSPDGRLIAVGHADTARVDLLDSRDLRRVDSADTRGVDQGFIALAWSADGSVLYGAGLYERGGRNPIRRWSGGRRQPRDIPAATSVVTHLLALRDGGLAFATSGGAFGVLDAAERVVWERQPAAADFRDQQDTLRVAADGGAVEFSFERFGSATARFSLAEKSLVLDAPPDPRLEAPLTDVPELNVADWRHGERPTLDGNPLALKLHEISTSLAVAPDRGGFVLGTMWRVIAFGADGAERWSVRAPGAAWAVNVTGNGKFVVAAFGDGTIRWLRLDDGRELLALFPHADRRRWVAWTPSGYYIASAAGDTLVGWHVNRGRERAGDFFTVSRFRDIYYRPDVVEKILGALDEDKAIRRGDAESGRPPERRRLAALLPPVVSILSPADGAAVAFPQVAIEYEVRTSTGEPVTAVHVRADGRPIATIERGIAASAAGARAAIDVYVPRRDAVVELIAETSQGIASEPASVRLRWEGPAAEAKPSLYVLAVGISGYRSPELLLQLAAKDAQDFARVLAAQEGRAYRRIVRRTLIDAEATAPTVRAALEWFANAPTGRDVGVLFMAGHGVDDPAGRYVYVPHEVAPEKALAEGVTYLEIRRALSRVAGRVFLFLDTCHSGAVWGRPTGSAVDASRIVNDLGSPEEGVVVFASSTGRQVSFENAEWGNGAFTKAVVEGLQGKADFFGNGYVTAAQLDAYVSDRVPKLTGGRQTPATGKPVNADFKLVELR
jgi:WD40 repeat protein